MTGAQLTVAVVGLGFGQEFVPIYLSHPDVARVVLVEPDADRRASVAARFGVPDSDTVASIDEVIADPTVDAVHILAPVPLHADLSVAVLEAGKHCACAVPMATSIADIDRIRTAQADSGTNYMMMETSVYGREYLTVRELFRAGAFGDPTLYRGFHIQNLDGFPAYWQGYPPMHYLTHALSPVLDLLDTTVDTVQCRGAGRLTDDRATGGFDNPYPTEVGLFTLTGSDVLADITMSFFQTARAYVEGFAFYGDTLGVEWPEDNEGPMTRHDMRRPDAGNRGNPVETSQLVPGDHPLNLPEPLRQFIRASEVFLPGMPEPATIEAHHGGSHPHLVHEFVSSIVEQRSPHVDATRAAQWTAPGICAHDSALAHGARVTVPRYAASAVPPLVEPPPFD